MLEFGIGIFGVILNHEIVVSTISWISSVGMSVTGKFAVIVVLVSPLLINSEFRNTSFMSKFIVISKLK